MLQCFYEWKGSCHEFRSRAAIGSPKSTLRIRCGDQRCPCGSRLGRARWRTHLPNLLTGSTSTPSVDVISMELGDYFWATLVLKRFVVSRFSLWSNPNRIVSIASP